MKSMGSMVKTDSESISELRSSVQVLKKEKKKNESLLEVIRRNLFNLLSRFVSFAIRDYINGERLEKPLSKG